MNHLQDSLKSLKTAKTSSSSPLAAANLSDYASKVRDAYEEMKKTLGFEGVFVLLRGVHVVLQQNKTDSFRMFPQGSSIKVKLQGSRASIVFSSQVTTRHVRK